MTLYNHPTAVTSPGGSVTAFTYDPAWRRTSMTLASGTAHAATTTYSYDTAGNLAATTDPAGRTTTYAYDISGHRVQEIAPLGLTTSWAYDAFGNTLAVTTPDGRTTFTTYDAGNRPLTVTDPNNATTAHTYHPGGAPASLTDARGNAYSFTYDLLGRKTAMLYPDGSSEQWAYNDSAGLASPRWTYTARDGSTMSCTADARGRDTFCDFSDPLTPDVTSAYDAAGRLVSASSSVSTSLYAYDAANQLVSETTSYSGLAGSRVVGYSYDMDGRRSRLVYPDGTAVDYTHTPRGQLAAITADGPPPLATFTYDPSGLPLSRTLENNTSTAYAYDGAGRLLSVAHSANGTAFRMIAYTLDPNSRRTSREENGDLAIYGYDPVGQLTSVASSANATYTYDLVGNRQNVTGAVPGAGGYLADALNRYTAAPGGGAAYDPRGNLVAHAGRTLAYDSRNRLVSATVAGHTVTTTYDHRNRAVKRTVDGTATYFVWDDWSLIAELDASGAVLQRYIQGPGIDNLVAKTNASGTVYYHQDGLGSTVALTDATGSNVESYTYDAFGAVRILDPSTLDPRPSSLFGNRFLFTGREWIAEAGLYDYRNRAYDPGLGRFLQTDPIRFEAGDVNLYRYVGNGVVDARDPIGLMALPGKFLPGKVRDILGMNPFDPPALGGPRFEATEMRLVDEEEITDEKGCCIYKLCWYSGFTGGYFPDGGGHLVMNSSSVGCEDACPPTNGMAPNGMNPPSYPPWSLNNPGAPTLR